MVLVLFKKRNLYNKNKFINIAIGKSKCVHICTRIHWIIYIEAQIFWPPSMTGPTLIFRFFCVVCPFLSFLTPIIFNKSHVQICLLLFWITSSLKLSNQLAFNLRVGLPTIGRIPGTKQKTQDRVEAHTISMCHLCWAIGRKYERVLKLPKR